VPDYPPSGDPSQLARESGHLSGPRMLAPVAGPLESNDILASRFSHAARQPA
jgi:hypothetical protein